MINKFIQIELAIVVIVIANFTWSLFLHYFHKINKIKNFVLGKTSQCDLVGLKIKNVFVHQKIFHIVWEWMSMIVYKQQQYSSI